MTSESQTWFTSQPKLFTDKRRGTWRAGCLEIGHVRFGGGRLVSSASSDARPPTLLKATRALLQSHDLVAYEDLKIAHLVKNHHLAKSISDVSWGLFLFWVRDSGGPHSIPVIAVPVRFTTQDCSGCGKRVKKTLSMWTHICPECGLVLDRDWNAAMNILLAALEYVAAQNRTAGQAETGRSQERRNASGQGTSGSVKRLASVKFAG